MDYHVSRNNRQVGVFPGETIAAGLSGGSFFATDLVWAEGMPGWTPASQVFRAALANLPLTSAVPPLPPKPESHLVRAILVTLFCCQPLGIVSIVFAVLAESQYSAGDYEGARRSSESARTFANVAIGIGLAAIAIYLVLFAAGGHSFHSR